MAHLGPARSARWWIAIVLVLAAAPGTAQLEPSGDVFEVTTQTANSQNFPAVAAAADAFIVVWSNGNPTSPSADGSREGVFGQRHGTTGTRIGSEFPINTYTSDRQRFPSIATSADGDFVVVWEGVGASGTGVHGQRYDSSGAKQGSEFQIAADAFGPRVARSNDDSFVVTWWGGNDGGTPAPGGAFSVLARRYDAGGTALGEAFQVNTYTPNPQRNPAIALTVNGAFVVVWQSGQDGGDDGIYAQRYASNGTATGSEFLVNTYTTEFQAQPAVAADDAGNFVVVWQSNDQDGSSYGIFAQRFDSNGAPLGTEFQVNTYTQFDQSQPDVDMAADGRFVVAWGSTSQDGEGRGIFAQEFAANGTSAGTEFQVNTVTMGEQDMPAVGAIAAGAFVVAWDSGASGVLAQRYADATPTVPPSPTPTSTPPEGDTCPGDCDGSDIVLVNEVIRCVNISLETAAIDTCRPCDRDGSAQVVINELVQAVNALLRGCPE